MKRLLKQKNVGKQPVENWYQSKGSGPWETPTFKHTSLGFQSGRYLLRETPKRMYQWNTRKKKTISPKGKHLLVQTVLENEAFNTKEKIEHVKERKKKPVAKKKAKNSKCYICREKGHPFWACERRKKLAGVELEQEVNLKNQIIDQERMYPEKVYIYGDYTVQGTDEDGWNDIWYVSKHYKFHMCPRRIMFNDVNYKSKLIGKDEYECKFIFSYGIGTTTIKQNWVN